MNIIVEGIDRSGKSTVCKYLESLGYPRHHFDYPWQADVVQIYDDYFAGLSQKADFAYDRAMYSEWVYSRYYHRDSVMTKDQIHRLELKFKEASTDGNACILYVENEPLQNLKLLNEEGEGKITSLEEILQLRKLYYDVLKLAKLPIFTYNYNFQDLDSIIHCMLSHPSNCK